MCLLVCVSYSCMGLLMYVGVCHACIWLGVLMCVCVWLCVHVCS